MRYGNRSRLCAVRGRNGDPARDGQSIVPEAGERPAAWPTDFLRCITGITEEILFRGLLFRLSSKIVGTWGALIFTSGLFGLAHLANRGASIRSSIAIALEAGVLLGATYAATRRLWLPIGLHAGWNFTEGSLFGMTLSGNTMGVGLLRGSLSGPEALTGGAFGPEASIVAVLVCLLAALFFLWRIVKLHRVEAPMWSKTPDSIPGTEHSAFVK